MRKHSFIWLDMLFIDFIKRFCIASLCIASQNYQCHQSALQRQVSPSWILWVAGRRDIGANGGSNVINKYAVHTSISLLS